MSWLTLGNRGALWCYSDAKTVLAALPTTGTAVREGCSTTRWNRRVWRVLEFRVGASAIIPLRKSASTKSILSWLGEGWSASLSTIQTHSLERWRGALYLSSPTSSIVGQQSSWLRVRWSCFPLSFTRLFNLKLHWTLTLNPKIFTTLTTTATIITGPHYFSSILSNSPRCFLSCNF